MEKLTLEEKLKIRKKKAAVRNTIKRTVTTKSFNDRKNLFVPRIKQERNPDAELFKKLKSSGKISKNLKYKDWLFSKLKNV